MLLNGVSSLKTIIMMPIFGLIDMTRNKITIITILIKTGKLRCIIKIVAMDVRDSMKNTL